MSAALPSFVSAFLLECDPRQQPSAATDDSDEDIDDFLGLSNQFTALHMRALGHDHIAIHYETKS